MTKVIAQKTQKETEKYLKANVDSMAHYTSHTNAQHIARMAEDVAELITLSKYARTEAKRHTGRGKCKAVQKTHQDANGREVANKIFGIGKIKFSISTSKKISNNCKTCKKQKCVIKDRYMQ